MNKITINKKQLKVALALFEGVFDTDESEIIIVEQKSFKDSESGEHMPAGLYAMDAKYPEEGVMPLGK